MAFRAGRKDILRKLDKFQFGCNTNLLSCRLTHSGKDYTGIKATTATGRRCQFWDTSYPVHKIAPNISDEDFPEGSRKDARNYCRNPTNASRGPWCYTLDSDVPYEECDVPLCSSKDSMEYYKLTSDFQLKDDYDRLEPQTLPKTALLQDCKMSGLGIDYSGNVKKPFSGDSGKCSKWTDRELFPEGRFADRLFPEGSRSSAGRFCRNPDGNLRGPWCPLDRGDGSPAIRAPCEIPFCKDVDWLEFTAETNEFTQFTDLSQPNKTLPLKTVNLTFGIRLWDAASWSRATAKILFSPFSIPGAAQELSKFGAVELTISKDSSGFTKGLEEVELWMAKGTPFRSEIAGSDWPWLQLWVQQSENVLAMGRQGSEEPLSSGQMSDLSVDLGLRFISISGAGILWSLPFTVEDCLQHITSELQFTRFFRMQQTPGGHDVKLHVRARHSACLQLRIAPSIKYPSFMYIHSEMGNLIEQGANFHSEEDFRYSMPSWVESAKAIRYQTREVRDALLEVSNSNVELKTKSEAHLLAVNKLESFKLIVGFCHMFFWVRSWDTKLLLEIEHELIKQLQWFSPGSNNSVAHWAFWCHPQDPPSALPPDCVASSVSSGSYGGGQYSASSGKPCIFWPSVPGSALGPDARNLCRNPDSSRSGPWCYVGKTGSTDYKKETCDVPVCLSVECRLAGTGNDFIGPLNVTRSGRQCQPWLDNKPHKVNQTYLNDTLFAERSLKEARNYCRDPSRNIGGPWCYTVDPKLPRDLCHAYDCVMPEGCTMLTQGAGAGRDLMILPRWRTRGLRFWLKEWNPERADGIVWLLRKAGTNTTYLRLELGADKNEKIKLFLIRGEGTRDILVEEKEHSHVIPIGQWAGMWLKLLAEGGLEVGREGAEQPLFAWKPKKVPAANFFPERVSYASLAGHTIGVVFPCEECHVEITNIRRFTKVLPLSLWRREPLAQPPSNLTLYMRGYGAVLVPLIMQPGEGDYHAVTLGEGRGADRIYLLRQRAGNLSEVGKVRLPQPIFSKDKWTKIIIRWTETKLLVWWNGLLFLAVDTKEPLVAYFFSVGIEDGEMMWTANCEPPDVDSPAVDGGWSEWGPATSCSATCGGGWGLRKRRCDNPPPTLKGRDCEGDDTMDEQCNTFPCGQLAPGTDEVVRRMLRRQHAATEADEGDNVTLACARPALLARVMQEAPEAVLFWEHQGRRVQGHVLTDLGGDIRCDCGQVLCWRVEVCCGAARARVSLDNQLAKNYSFYSILDFPLFEKMQ
ncbi:uncharacterized protein LOC124620192 [Schistocerca americana]|uniref:uncharacterized protein LOC124620192 n=1 Tax=Schistocerca americana TaxID=7009 RepID=UPI001F500A89|nr:uncharacterized protein LOC124620192 [Schistocerca americana]